MEASPSQTRHNRKIKKILQVAARLFAKKGYEKVSVEEIAWKLNLSKGSLYHYFKSKEEVLYLIQMDAIEIGIAAQTKVLESDREPMAKLTAAIRNHMEIITRPEVAGALKQQELILPPPLRARVIEARDQYEEIFRQIIREGVDAGVFSARDWRLSCIAVLGLLNGIPRWFSPKGKKSLHEVTEAVTDFIIKGFQAGNPPRMPGQGPSELGRGEGGKRA